MRVSEMPKTETERIEALETEVSSLREEIFKLSLACHLMVEMAKSEQDRRIEFEEKFEEHERKAIAVSGVAGLFLLVCFGVFMKVLGA